MELTATNTVLGTTELLERVLLQTDMRTLLVSVQRVCRRWNELITTSPSLQKHLFLQPDHRLLRQGEVRIKNPLLAKYFTDWFPNCWGAHRGGRGLSNVGFGSHHVQSYPFAKDDALNAAMRHPKATWRQMLPCQPPLQKFVRCTFTQWMGGESIDLSFVTQAGTQDISSADGYLGGALTTEPHAPVPTDLEPIDMDTFYHIVTLGYGDSHDWIFVWDDGGGDKRVDIPATIHPSRMHGRLKENLDRILHQDGFLMFEAKTNQCTGGAPWRFNERLIFREHTTRFR